MSKHNILIIGGGNAGISVAARLLRAKRNLDIAIIEPSEKHYYQPAWTLVGGGTFNINATVRTEASVMPKGVTWYRDGAATIDPDRQVVTTVSGLTITYDYLVVAPGIQLNWNDVKGLKENLGKNGITSNYSFATAPYTFECLKRMREGQVALF
ncbi:MAG: hypothetical protein RL732_764, partial [Bacteroidota bacterium]